MPRVVPYELFLLRRLQQAQRLAAVAAARLPGEGAVVPFPRRPKRQPQPEGHLAAVPEGAQI